MTYEKVRSRSTWALLAVAVLLGWACRHETPPLVDEPPNGRLSGDVRPTAYRLDLTLDPRRDDFGGRVEIDVELAEASDRVWLHGRDLDVASATARLPDGREVAGEYSQELPTGVAALRFAETLPAGPATLALEYSARFDRNLAGLFKVEEQGDSYALAKSESVEARGYLPGFDEPGMKATFDIRLTIPEDMVAIGNAPEVGSEPVGDGLRTVTFATTPPMSTYLLSLAVGPFDVVERDDIPPNEFRTQPIPLRGVARRGRGGDMGYVLDITPRLVEIFERELRRPYPFRKLDVVAAPAWPSGATELSGAITYREQILLVGDNPPPGARRGLIGVHAHEIAHMWFGNLVTPPWWDDLWLKEGFATWASPLALSLFEPDGGHEIDGAATAIRAMGLDSLASTRAIREDIDHNEDIRSAYDGITYAKSLGVIHMVDRYFGADRFRPVLGRYVEAFADGVADSADFYRVIGEEAGSPELTDTFRTFVEQKGVPTLRIELDCGPDESSLEVSQSRYAALGSPIADLLGDGGPTWTIPFCFRGASAVAKCEMLTEPTQRLRIDAETCPDWVMPNADGDGYYRWTLDEGSWSALLDAWSELTPREALHVVDSAFAAFEAGSLSPELLWRVVVRTAGSYVRQVVEAPLDPLAKYLRDYSPREANLALLVDLYRPVLARTAGSGDADDRLLRSDVLGFLALRVGDPEARRDLLERAHAFTGFGQDRDPKALDSDLYGDALTVAMQDTVDLETGGFLDHLVEFRQTLDDPRFDNASAQALGRTTTPGHVATIHELAMAESTDPRETVQMLGTAMAEPALRDSHWAWVRENFPAIAAKVPAQRRHLTPMLGDRFCQPDRLEELRQLFAEHGDLTPGYETKLAQVEETIGLCIALRERGEAFIESLAANG